jgi:hypothetical protein
MPLKRKNVYLACPYAYHEQRYLCALDSLRLYAGHSVTSAEYSLDTTSWASLKSYQIIGDD